MTQNKPLITVKTLSLKLAKQIVCPKLDDPLYLDLKKVIIAGQYPIDGWVNGGLIFENKIAALRGYQAWILWLVKKDNQLFWVLADDDMLSQVGKNKNMQQYISQLFVS